MEVRFMTTKNNRHITYALTTLLLAFLLGLAACGSDSENTNRATATPPVAGSEESAPAEQENHEEETPTAVVDNQEDATHNDEASHNDEAEHSEEMAPSDEAEHSEGEGMHSESEEGMHEDMAMAHDVPAEFAEMENPISATEESIARGQELYQTHCAACHGETGQGDGAAAAGLEPKPANLSDAHVQGNTDGSIFYTISQGVEGTAMVGWENQIA